MAHMKQDSTERGHRVSDVAPTQRNLWGHAQTGTAPSNMPAELESDALRNAKSGALYSYVHAGEELAGFGHGGSESLTMFLRVADSPLFVRKVLSERLVTPDWNIDGRDVMLAPVRKAKRQAAYLRALPDDVKSLFPIPLGLVERDVVADGPDQRVARRELIYDMSYVGGLEVSRFVERHKPHPKVVALLYCEIFKLLRKRIHAHRRRTPRAPTLEPSYFTKIEKRLELCTMTAPKTFGPHLLSAPKIFVNGQLLRNVPTLLAEFRRSPVFRVVLEPRFHTLVVGDTNTENIKIGNIAPLLEVGPPEDIDFATPPFTAEDLQIRFLDPRAIGFHEDGVDTGSDDPMYDNKPWHNSIGNYDYVHGEHFDLETTSVGSIPSLDVHVHPDNPYAASYAGIERYFDEVMSAAWGPESEQGDLAYDDPYWLVRFIFMMGTHFMAMPPFHFSKTPSGELVDEAQAQKRTLAIYAEGIKWLNLALDTLEGRRRSFLGVNVRLPAELGSNRVPELRV